MTQHTNFFKKTYLWSFILLLGACKGQVAISDIQNAPPMSSLDEQYANVYKSLDGNWRGEFLIYEDTILQKKDKNKLFQLTPASLEQLGLKLSNKIQVKQTYTSESPYFQRVIIEDYYPEKDQAVMSKGVNKIQDGKMWCVVQKPDELILHEGGTDGDKTILWQRKESNPQRIEYFRETVEENTYEIIGWGYYEGDDPSLMPRYWFYGKYARF